MMCVRMGRVNYGSSQMFQVTADERSESGLPNSSTIAKSNAQTTIIQNPVPHDVLLQATPLILTERWRMTKLKALVDMPWSFTNSASHTKVSNIYERLVGQPTVRGFAELVCNYNPSTNLSSGRLYGTGFQGVPGFVRRLCAPVSYRDVDIENCYPTILVQEFEKHGIQCPNLRVYIENREAIILSDIREYGVTRKVAKTAYLKILFRGKPDYPSRALAALDKEIGSVAKQLWAKDSFKEIRRLVINKYETDEYNNKYGTFLSYVAQVAERKIIDCAINFFRNDKKIDVVCNMFDGFMVDGADSLPLDECAKAVREQTNYTVRFVEKPMRPEESDSFKLRHPFNDHRQTNDWDLDRVFRRLQAEANELNKNGNPESNLAKFEARTVELMNMVVAAILNEQDLNIVHREVDPQKGVVYWQMDTSRGFKEKYQNRVYKIKVPQTKKRKVTDMDAATKVDTYLEVCPAVMWINSPMRLQYKRKVFCPAPYENDENCARSDELNDWTGFTHKQTRSYTTDQLASLELGPLKAFTDYMKDIVCNGDLAVRDWLMNWLSWTVKRPWVKLTTVPILRSDDEGTGKTTIAELMRDIMGLKYYVKPNTVDELQRNFNEHLFATTKLMVLDEAHKGNSKSAAGAFRNVITQEEAMLERKHKDPRMQRVWYNIIMLTNDKKVVQIPGSNRRFVVIEVNSRFGGPYTAEMKAYFNPVYATDKQVLFDYLCSLPNDDWDYRSIPPTDATIDQVVSSFDPIDAFFHTMLVDPCRYIASIADSDPDRYLAFAAGSSSATVNSYNPEQRVWVRKESMFEGYVRYTKNELCRTSKMYHDPTSESFWKRFRKTFPAWESRRTNSSTNDGTRYREICLPSVHDMRDMFRKAHKSQNFFKTTEAEEQVEMQRESSSDR